MRRLSVLLAVVGMVAGGVASAGATGGDRNEPKQARATPKVFYLMADASTLMVRLEEAEYLPTEDPRLWVVPAGVAGLGQAVTRITYVNGDELTSYEFAPTGKQVFWAPALPAPQTARFRYALYRPSATGGVRLIPLDAPDAGAVSTEGGTVGNDAGEQRPPALTARPGAPAVDPISAAKQSGDRALTMQVAATHPAPRVLGAGPITGLVVDCRGLRMERSAAPKILNTEGAEVYGTIRGSDEAVAEIVNMGIVCYYHSLDEALAGNRVGPNPLIVVAVGSVGVSATCRRNAVVMSEDAQLVFATNQTAGFLDKLAVAFIIDR